MTTTTYSPEHTTPSDVALTLREVANFAERLAALPEQDRPQARRILLNALSWLQVGLGDFLEPSLPKVFSARIPTMTELAPNTQAAAAAPQHVPRMTDDDLRAFVVEYCDGRIFTSANLAEPDLLGVVFMPLLFGALDRAYHVEEIGVLWERMSEAGPRAVNGMPTFFSMHLMHKDDWERAFQAIQTESQRRKEIAIP